MTHISPAVAPVSPVVERILSQSLETHLRSACSIAISRKHRPFIWKEIEGSNAAIKLRKAGDGSVVYQNPTGTFSYAHFVEGIGMVARKDRFAVRAGACLAADVDYLDLTTADIVDWVNRDRVRLAA